MKALRPWAPRLALIALLFYVAAWNIAFIKIDTRPPNNNELNHILPSVDMWLWSTTRPGLLSAYLQSFSGYPPITLLATAAYSFLGPSYDAAMLVQTFFFLLWLVGIYMLCGHAFSKWAGVLAALVLGTFPSVLDVSRQFLLEFPLAASSTWAAYALLKSRGFENRGWSLAAGLFVGLATLSKQTFFVYASGPLLAALLWAALRRSVKTDAPEKDKPGRLLSPLRLTMIALIWILAYGLYIGPLGKHREAINLTFQGAGLFGLDPAWLFFALTGIIGTTLALLLAGRPTRPRNVLAACLGLALVASVWYFPKGLHSLLGYIGQMRENVGAQESVTLEKLLSFYGIYLGQYYFGFIKGWLTIILIGLLAISLAATAARKLGARVAFGPDTIWTWLMILLWLLIPAAAFLILPIQNEMNLVPAMGPAAALVAGLVHQARLFSRPGSRPSGVGRAMITANRASLALIVVLLIAEGSLFPAFFKRGDGTYMPLPIECGNERDQLALIRSLSPGSWKSGQPLGVRFRSFLVRKGFYLKFPDFRYFIPFEDDWRIERIADLLAASGLAEKPVLFPEQGFYFSFNSLAFSLACRGFHAEINGGFKTPAPEGGWDMEGARKEIERFDAIIVRESLPQNETEASDTGGEGSDRDLTLRVIRSGDPGFLRNFVLADRVELPERTSALVYIRSKDNANMSIDSEDER